MPGIERSSWAVRESGVFEGVCGGFREPRCRARCTVEGESSSTPLGVIEVIHAAPRGTAVTKRKGVLAVVPVEDCSSKKPFEKKMKFTQEPIIFNNNDLEGAIQLHDKALVVTARINGFFGNPCFASIFGLFFFRNNIWTFCHMYIILKSDLLFPYKN